MWRVSEASQSFSSNQWAQCLICKSGGPRTEKVLFWQVRGTEKVTEHIKTQSALISKLLADSFSSILFLLDVLYSANSLSMRILKWLITPISFITSPTVSYTINALFLLKYESNLWSTINYSLSFLPTVFFWPSDRTFLQMAQPRLVLSIVSPPCWTAKTTLPC